MPSLDILGLGSTSVDDLLYVAAYPAADSKARVLRRQRQCGGLTATALVAAARMGARCAYAGTLGDDELSRFTENRLREEGIDLDHLRREPGRGPVHSVIVVDDLQTRTIFYDLEQAGRAGPDWPPEALIRASKVLFVDEFGIAGMIRAARVIHAAGGTVVGDFENVPAAEGFAELVAAVDHCVVPVEFARQWTGREHPGDAAVALLAGRRAAVVTCGAEGCWYAGDADPGHVRHQPAFAVDVVDTTGCGDVFHGVYAAGLAQGLDLPTRIHLAAAAAALKATQPGGQAGIPRREAVDRFILQHKSGS